MTRVGLCVVAIVGASLLPIVERAAGASGQRQTLPAPGSTISTAVKCAADLGRGEKSRRQFCDVLIGGGGPQSIVLAVPAHRGDSVLMFDLHNRFVVPAGNAAPEDAFASHAAIVAVVSASGDVLTRAVVSREYRTVDDLFDRIEGGGRTGGLKAVAPGYAEPIRVTIPAAVSAVGIVGQRLDETTRAGRVTFETPGRPVAIASNFRLEYVPR